MIAAGEDGVNADDKVFGIEHCFVERRADGSALVRSSPALADWPQRYSDRLVHWAREAPDRTFVARRDPAGAWRRITYAQAHDTVRRLGQALLERGLSAERPLVILSENDLEHAMLAQAAQYVGVPHAPVSVAYSLVSRDFEKLRRIVALLTPGLVYASDGRRYEAAIEAAVPAGVEVAVGTAPPARGATPYSALACAEAGPRVDAARLACGPDTPFKFLFTSGSTSQPKAVITTNRMICSNLQMIRQALPPLARAPVLVDWLPWSHTFGGSHNVGIVMFGGGTLYIDDGKPVPGLFETTLANLREIAPTVYFNVPRGFEILAQVLRDDPAFRDHFFSRLSMLFYAGAGMPQPVWDALYAASQAATGRRVPIVTGLGMTETAPSALFTNRADVRSGMIGLPCPGVVAKLAPMGDKTEIRYRGPSVTPGYWRNPQASAQAFDEEGFFRSGDAVVFVDPSDPDLGFRFDGRIAEDFKLATGTWVSVGPLRAAFVALGDPFVQDAVVAGLDRDEVGLLVFPNIDALRARVPAPLRDAPADELAACAPVRSIFSDLLARLASRATGSANRPARALLLIEPASIDLGEITDKGSVNQRAVLAHRAAAVDALYDDSNPAVIRPGGAA